MRIITINLSEAYLDAIQTLNDIGKYPSRSEAIRVALADFLKDELGFYQDLNENNFEKILKNSIKRKKYWQTIKHEQQEKEVQI